MTMRTVTGTQFCTRLNRWNRWWGNACIAGPESPVSEQRATFSFGVPNFRISYNPLAKIRVPPISTFARHIQPFGWDSSERQISPIYCKNQRCWLEMPATLRTHARQKA